MDDKLDIRNILDVDGTVIGTLGLPMGTSEDTWTAQLALHAYVPPVLTAAQIAKQSVDQAAAFGVDQMHQFSAGSLLLGIVRANQFGNFLAYVQPLIPCLIVGALPQAVVILDGFIADTSDAKNNLAPFIDNTRLETLKNTIQTYLGVPLT